MRKTLTRYALGGVAALALGLISAPAIAHCDFITGGGWIERPNGAKANFGVAGGCKHGSFWGHLNYLDHGNTPAPGVVPPPFHVHWLTITNYLGAPSGDEKEPKRTGTREICGTATTNHPAYPVVDFRVEVTDMGEPSHKGEPGHNDTFKIRLGVEGAVIYSTYGDPDHRLGGGGPGGGNIQLHKPNPSTATFPTDRECNI